MSMIDPHRGSALTAGRLVLFLLLMADAVLVAVFLYNTLVAAAPQWWMNLSDDRGWAEFVLHLKQLWVVALMGVLWWVRRQPVLVGWLLVALFYGIDDLLHLHEWAGRELDERGPTLPLVDEHANHVYEVAWLAAWGLVLGTVLVVLHRAAAPSARALSRRLGMLFGLLIFVGVVLDALHVLVEDISYANGLMVIAEEGGEHLVMSFLVATLVTIVALDRWPGFGGHWLLPPDAQRGVVLGDHSPSR